MAEKNGNYWTDEFWRRAKAKRLSRRRAIQLGAVGAATTFVGSAIACGDDDDDADVDSPVEDVDGEGAFPDATDTEEEADEDETAEETEEAEEEVFLGGTLRSTISDPQSKFDAQLFPTFTVQGANSFSYSRLLRSISGPDDTSTEELDLPVEEWYRPVPDLADLPENPDELTFTFTLREGAVWHDLPPLNGREATAEDVVAAFDYYRTARPDQGRNLAAVESVSAVGPNQVQFTLSQPFGPFLVAISSPSDLWIYPPELIATPDQLNATMVGTGPFVLREYQQGVGFKWDKNPNWFEVDEQGNQLPYVDALDFPIIPDKNNEISQFTAGNLDTMTVPGELIDVLRDQVSDLGIQKNIANLLTMLFFPPSAYAANEPPFNDPRVRQAVSLAIDREALIDLASGGNGGAKHNLINAGFLWYLDPDGSDVGDTGGLLQYNPEEARALLDAAGIDTLETELHYTNNAYVTAVPYYNPVAEALPPMLRDAGIEVTLVTHDYQSEWIEPTNGIFFGGLQNGIAFALETPVNHPFVQFTNQFSPDNARNHSKITDDTILGLIEELSAETDFDAARELAWEIQRLNAENMYYVPLIGPFGFTAFQPYVRRWAAPTSFGVGSESTPHFQIARE